MPSRRHFIQSAALLGASGLSTQVSATDKSSPQKDQSAPKAKNIIFLVADGMGTGTLSFANHWMRAQHQRELNWMKCLKLPEIHCSIQDTASANSPVTDSAAAASAWGGGKRVNNGTVNISPQGKKNTPILVHAKQAGKATGLVTTCQVTHATPAGFTANAEKRSMQHDIAQQYLERHVDVILGGGREHFSGNKNDKELVEKFRQQGYQIVNSRSELESIQHPGKILGTFSRGHLPFAIDRKNNPKLKEIPGLQQMFKTALQSLSHASNGFVLQVEAGRVDHAGHANDPIAILHEQLEFDSCIPVAIEFIKQHPDTLLIITTDHGTGGCQLNGWGEMYSETMDALQRINGIKTSLSGVASELRRHSTFKPELFKRLTGLTLTAKQQKQLSELITKKPTASTSAIVNQLREIWFESTAVGWTSHNHTSEHVPLMATGPGAAAIPALINNNELFGIMTQALGVKT